ncbi:MAG: pseudouridine synthase [Candidatus Sulfotelmatobacter sp.]
MRENEVIRRVGLARVLSKLGYCSRSQAAEMIRAGRVSLNGKIKKDPETPVSEAQNHIAVDGKIIEPLPRIYLIMNKPRGVLTTASDEKGRETVYALLSDFCRNKSSGTKKIPPWLAPVGRLDKASEGLLLLTNDSEWAALVTAPQSHLEKTYHVQVGTVADEEFIQKLVRGVRTKDEDMLRAKQARLLRTGQRNCWLEIVLDEGKNRQIRRLMAGTGIEVLRLIRVAIGALQLGDLAKGEYRALTLEEKRMLDCALRKKTS